MSRLTFLAEALSQSPDLPDQTILDEIISLTPLLPSTAEGLRHDISSDLPAAILVLLCTIPGAIYALGNEGDPWAEIRNPKTGASFTSVGPNAACALLSAMLHVLSKNEELAE